MSGVAGTAVLADTSVWIRAVRTGDEAFFSAVDDDDVLVCPIVVLELLAGLPSPSEVTEWRILLRHLRSLDVDRPVTDRAEDVLEHLSRARGGRHRAVPSSDLLIAACAERAGVVLVHDDRHFERIADVTGQPQRRPTA